MNIVTSSGILENETNEGESNLIDREMWPTEHTSLNFGTGDDIAGEKEGKGEGEREGMMKG